MSRYYILQDGERFYAATEAAARKLARHLADATGKAVHGFEHKPRKITARRNPTGLQTLSKMRNIAFQVTAVSPPPRRARMAAYATTTAEAKQIRRELESQGYSNIVVKPASWKKNPGRKAKRRTRK
jgi:hypothetical protein